MEKIGKIVITGGPCSGKSSTIEAIKAEFGNQIVIVPEAATILLSNGFPVPGKDVEWSLEWQDAFQAAVVKLQQSMERSHKLIAKNRNAKLLICDRGIMDGAAYTPGGTKEFALRYAVDEKTAISNYLAVIHLESLAIAQPHLYGQGNNPNRFESLEEAQSLEQRTRDSWSKHPNQIILENKSDLATIIVRVSTEIKKHL